MYDETGVCERLIFVQMQMLLQSVFWKASAIKQVFLWLIGCLKILDEVEPKINTRYVIFSVNNLQGC